MAVLNICNLPEEFMRNCVSELQWRGAQYGGGSAAHLTVTVMEDETIISAESLQQWVDVLYADRKPTNVVDELIAEDEAQNE